MSARLMRQIVTGSVSPIVRKCEQAERAKCGKEKEEMSRTLTPPESGDEIARRMPVWSLGGQRMTASRTDERTPLRCRSDAAWPQESANHARWDANHKSNQGNDHEHND